MNLFHRLLSLVSPASVLVFCLPHRVLACRSLALLRAGSGRRVLDLPRSAQQAGGEVAREVFAGLDPSPEDGWAVGLPLRMFTMVSLQLPIEAEDDLDQAVRFALMRHVPHDLSELHVTHQAVHQEGRIDVQALVARRSEVRDFLEGMTASGVPVSAVFPSLLFLAAVHGRDGLYFSGGSTAAELLVIRNSRVTVQLAAQLAPSTSPAFFHQARTLLDNQPLPCGPAHHFASDLALPELSEVLPAAARDVTTLDLETLVLPRNPLRMPHQINLVSDEARRKRRLALGVQAGALAFLLLSLLMLPVARLLGQNRHLAVLEERIAQIRPQAEHLSGLREQSEAIIEDLQHVARLVANQPSVAEMLRELTEILPKTTWLTSFHVADGQVRIQGMADSASSVIEAVENSPLFHAVRLDAPVTKVGARDVFQISARLGE